MSALLTSSADKTNAKKKFINSRLDISMISIKLHMYSLLKVRSYVKAVRLIGLLHE